MFTTNIVTYEELTTNDPPPILVLRRQPGGGDSSATGTSWNFPSASRVSEVKILKTHLSLESVIKAFSNSSFYITC